jgi:hypothetical protein
MRLRSGHDMGLEVPDEAIIVIDQGQIDCDVFLHRWIGKALGDPLTLHFGLERLTSGGPIVLAVRLANMGQPLCSLAHQMQTALSQVAGGTHGGRIRIGLRQHAAPQSHGNLLGVETVMLGFAPVDRLHVLGVSQHTRHPFLDAQVGQPIPGKHAFHGHHEILTIRSNGLEKSLGSGWHIPVEHDLTVSVEDADIHRPGMQVDAISRAYGHRGQRVDNTIYTHRSRGENWGRFTDRSKTAS